MLMEALAPDDDGIDTILVTANVGSLFEDPDRLLQQWIEEFLRTISERLPQFLALHLQEVGGKTYEKSMEYVQEFIRRLCEAKEMCEYDVIRIFMDEDFNSAEHFTALGNLYFVHKRLKNVKIWNFLTHDWEVAESKNIFSGNIETIATKEKSKFPQNFFPECKWSRKGYMRTRWEIDQTVIDLVNIHLFHDASNLAACEEFPSVYCKTRRRALVHTLERFHVDEKNMLVPYFLFGDFNFRCDTEGVIKELTRNLTAHRVQNVKNDSTKVHYRNSIGDNVLTVGKKEFNHADHQLKFKESWLKKFDRELEVLNEVLVEYPIEFPPSYPYEEDPEMPTDFMSTRCPAWCDRILMSPQAMEIISDASEVNPYNMMGENICMGDHKPIYLSFRLKRNQGTYRCCKCYHSNAHATTNNNWENGQTTTHHNPTVITPVNNCNTIPYRCPYESEVYNRILIECKKLNKPQHHCLTIGLESLTENVPKTIDSNNTNTDDDGVLNNKCPISINIIDSDNIYVCNCAQISAANKENDVDGSICAECRNVIKRQPLEHRYRLISKRLVLSDDIIVNRIDSQHLNTFFDVTRQDRRDPYTPESIDSHSPCPELSLSTTTTTSSNNSRTPCEQPLTLEQQQQTKQGGTLIEFTSKSQKDASHYQHLMSNKESIYEIHQRGVVTPGQLKSRLEDLQRSSMQNLDNQESSLDVNKPTVDSDEDNVVVVVRDEKTCLPSCCNVQ